MLRKSLVLFVLCLTLTLSHSFASAGDTPSGTSLSAAAIAEKNVTARGGLQAWRGVQTISMTGMMGVGGNQRATLPSQSQGKIPALNAIPQRPVTEVQLPFVMKLKRPRKMRMEIVFKGDTAVQVYDGTNGWKLRPFLNRREIEPYSQEELQKAGMQADLDGPLVDYVAKGTQIELAGMEKVEDRNTYNLKLTLKDGHSMHVWIDAQTFLETKVEGQPRVLDGIVHPVEVYYRDYRPVNGLEIPFTLETKVLPVTQAGAKVMQTPVPVERITLDKVEVNPKLDESQFSKPEVLQSEAR